MKSQWLALPLVALLPTCALAQTQAQPKAPAGMASVSTDPAARALLARAIQNYKGASALSFRIDTSANGKVAGTTSVRFARPDKLSIERTSGATSARVLLNGSDFYVVQGTTYRKSATPPVGVSQLLQSAGVASGGFIAEMLGGKNPFNSILQDSSKPPFQNLKSRTIAVAPRVIDGDVLSGVQSNFSFDVPEPDGSKRTLASEITAWFGGPDSLLRRVQYRVTQDGKTNTLSERIFDQQLNPAFATDAFKFNATGLQPVSDEEAAEENHFDPRLKVGSRPFAFKAKSLDGKTISLDHYKGKVVILDFWATWCGPCVAAMPGLKSSYKKYRSQGLEVVGISLDEDKSSVTSFSRTHQLTWPQIFDGKAWESPVPNRYSLSALPFTLLIGKDGKIASVNPNGFDVIPLLITFDKDGDVAPLLKERDMEGAIKSALVAS